MINKISKLQGIGRFHAHTARGEVTFRQVTLVYGQNGRGKSTLADVLRSLASGDPKHLTARKTIGAGAQPMHAEIAITGEEPVTFTAKGWSRTLPNIAVFDSIYVRENVHAGDTVTRDHKRNLYRVVVGRQAVELAKVLDAAEASLDRAAIDVKEAERLVGQHLPPGYGCASFAALLVPTDINERHQAAANELTQAKGAAQMKDRQLLGSLVLPTLPSDLLPLLAESMAGLSAQAEARVRAHLHPERSGATQPWLESGLDMIRGERCPFCDQSISGLDLIASYRAYFDAAYRDLQLRVSGARATVEQALADRTLTSAERVFAANAKLVTEWTAAGVVTAPAPTIDWESLQERLAALKEAALSLVDRKRTNPLEALAPGDDLRDAAARFDEGVAQVRAYTGWVVATNATLTARKQAAGKADIPGLERRVAVLAAQQKRVGELAAIACKNWQDACAAKEVQLALRDEAKTALNKHTDDIFEKQQLAINKLLEHFGASFRLAQTKHSYVGGDRSCEYRIEINGANVPLGASKLEPGETSFASLLSSGDKSTLALALFLTEIAALPEGETIVVFDDPFTSQDASRRFCTRKQIVAHTRRHKQVIVLSHDDRFLRGIRREVGKEASALRVHVGEQGSKIVPWEIEAETGSEYAALRASFRGGQPTQRAQLRERAGKVRELLEWEIRLRYPDVFHEKATLGGMIDDVAKAGPGDALAAVRPLLNELRELRDFTNPLHHGGGVAGEVEERELDPDEVDAYLGRAEEVIGAL